MRPCILPTSHVGGRRQVLRRLHVGLPVHGLSAWGEGGNVGPPRVHPHFGQVREGGRERARDGRRERAARMNVCPPAGAVAASTPPLSFFWLFFSCCCCGDFCFFVFVRLTQTPRLLGLSRHKTPRSVVNPQYHLFMVQQESAGKIHALLRPLPRVSSHLSALGGRGIACLYPASFFFGNIITQGVTKCSVFRVGGAGLPAHMIQSTCRQLFEASTRGRWLRWCAFRRL